MMKNATYSTQGHAARRGAMRGVAAVELALLIIPMLLLVFGVAEYGRALYQYNTLVKSVRDSARMLTLYSPSDADYPLAQAKCQAVYGTSCDKKGAPLLPGLTTDMVIVCNPTTAEGCDLPAYGNVPTGNGTINLVEVRIHGYQFTPMVPAVTNVSVFMFNDIRVTMRQIL